MSKEIGITESNGKKIVKELAILLADENILFLKTKNAHWNVEGNDFLPKHQFFESQISELNTIIDRVAERIRMIGHYAPSNMKDYLELTRLTEKTKGKNSSQELIQDLLINHESIIMHLRGKTKISSSENLDAGTNDFLIGIMSDHEKMAWFLRSHLKK